MLDIKQFKKCNIAINCRTVEEAIEFRDWLCKHSITWCTGNHLYKYDKLKWADEFTCYRFDGRGLVRGKVYDYNGPDMIIPNVTVIPYKEAFGVKVDVAHLIMLLGE